MSRAVICDYLAVSQTDRMGNREVQERLRWDEIDAVLAYKRDCFSIDQIRVALIDRNGMVRMDISEEDGGYRALIEELPRRLAGCLTQDQWFQRVAIPAFETNMTELYRSPSSPTSSAP